MKNPPKVIEKRLYEEWTGKLGLKVEDLIDKEASKCWGDDRFMLGH